MKDAKKVPSKVYSIPHKKGVLMKKLLKITCLALGAVCSLEATRSSELAGNVTSHTFFSIRPQYDNLPQRLSFFRNDLLDEGCNTCWGGAAQVVVFGGRSTEPEKIAQYFLPPTVVDSCCLRVAEGNPDLVGTPAAEYLDLQAGRQIDAEARNFNIATIARNFASNVCFEPRQQFFGVAFHLKGAFSRCEGLLRSWWELTFPIVRVKNTMNLQETVLNSGGGADGLLGLDNAPHVSNMTEAFRQSNWKYGKIENCFCDSKTGIADMEFRFGWTPINSECCRLDSYIGVLFPTGNRPKNHHVFEPIVGNNKHFGFLFGASTQFVIWQSGCKQLKSLLDINNKYLFRNYQFRTFDLIGKPWSRYQEVYQNRDQAFLAADILTPNRDFIGTSGVNVFTQCSSVYPRFSTDINSAWLYTHDFACSQFMVEAGFNFYARQAEQVIPECCNFNPAIKGFAGDGQTSFTRTIKDNVACADVFPDGRTGITYAGLTIDDLDLYSAAHPAYLSTTGYVTFGYKWGENCPNFVGIGASLEGAHNNTALERWTIWAKYGITY